jgi:hypothetical protein
MKVPFIDDYRIRLLKLIAGGICLCFCCTAHPASGIAVGSGGQVYFVDTARGVFEINGTGRMTRLSESNEHWMALDRAGSFGEKDSLGTSSTHIYRVTARSENPAIYLSSGVPIAFGRDGALYYATYSANEPLHFIRQTSDHESVFATVTSSADGEPLHWINGISSGPDGTIYFTENDAVRKISADGRVSTVVSGLTKEAGKPVPGIGAHLGPFLRGLAIDGHDNILVAASGSCSVLKITPTGKVTDILRTESPWSPTGVAVAGDDIYVLEYRHTASDVRQEWLPRVRKISADGKEAIIGSIEK